MKIIGIHRFTRKEYYKFAAIETDIFFFEPSKIHLRIPL